MMKDVSKYLFSRDGKNGWAKNDAEECIVLSPGMSAAVNKLTALLAAAKYYNPDSSAINNIEKESKAKICNHSEQRTKMCMVTSFHIIFILK